MIHLICYCCNAGSTVEPAELVRVDQGAYARVTTLPEAYVHVETRRSSASPDFRYHTQASRGFVMNSFLDPAPSSSKMSEAPVVGERTFYTLVPSRTIVGGGGGGRNVTRVSSRSRMWLVLEMKYVRVMLSCRGSEVKGARAPGELGPAMTTACVVIEAVVRAILALRVHAVCALC